MSRAAAPPQALRLLYFSMGFLRQRRLRDILRAAGYTLVFGPAARVRAGDGVVVWGKSPTAARGERFAARHALPIVRLEDAFVRSAGLGRAGAMPLGLIIDPVGVHFDAAAPSLIENILATHPLDDTQLLARARDGMARLRALDISKYNLHDPALPAPDAGYVLVIDQTRGDASIPHGGADAARFAQMLQAARKAHPNTRILIKTHPETVRGYRAGHFSAADCDDLVQIYDQNTSPWALLDGAVAVYTVTSQMGMEAIFAGHRPQVFGQPFYAGWGLSDDHAAAPARRARSLTRTQLFAAAYVLAPQWFSPHLRALCSFEQAVDVLQADLRAQREDAAGYAALNMRAWKRGRLQAVFGQQKPLIFIKNPNGARGLRLMVWGAGDGAANAQANSNIVRVEDGLLRSRGLGAALTPPISLIADDIGIYYNPAQPSKFEALMMQPLPPDARARAAVFLEGLISARLSKYNLPSTSQLTLPPSAQNRRRILVPGQVADDASLRFGAGVGFGADMGKASALDTALDTGLGATTNTGRFTGTDTSTQGTVPSNLDLLRAARLRNPDAFIIYKPHPDVEAGLRAGALPADIVAALADMQAADADPIAAIEAVDEVFTLTSTLGFEALLRGRAVTCLGAPFYAGWGLTHDLGPPVARRQTHLRHLVQSGLPVPDIVHLVHAALIAYPRYYDPVTRSACPPEIALLRLGQNAAAPWAAGGMGLRLLSKLQGRFASYAHWWR